MGKQPAAIIIARHGSRLDQANQQWIFTSPTPYDPPLTYGGWAQCQALGLRIGSILNAREEEERRKQAGGRRRRKRQRVVIHSSPFIRCVQTSVAISAGIGQYQHEEVPEKGPKSSPLSKSLLRTDDVKSVNANGSAEQAEQAEQAELDEHGYLPTKLKVDAFLGEWLSPDYFENITPPPSSTAMVEAAKADLMRPAEEIRGADLAPVPNGRLSTGWLTDAHELNASQAVPHRTRAATFGTDRKSHPRFTPSDSIQEEGFNYTPPIPTYAISSSEAIPIGFVAHARDACVEVDYQWDSMRPPHDWGNGGDFGEEWSSMHRRFRSGLQRLLAYYEDDEGNEEDDDLVLVLVTHGAGCNALIGALTSAPVLLDVGVASLTMAVRKAETQTPTSTSPSRRRSSLGMGLANQFDMKVIASTEHLRSGPNPLGLNSPRLGRSPAFASRRMVGADSLDGFSIGDPLAWRPSSSSGLGRSASQRATPSSVLPTFSTGLWRTHNSTTETTDSSESEALPNFDSHRREKNRGPSTREIEKGNAEAAAKTAQVPARTTSQTGLWGSGGAEEKTAKRRWTSIDAGSP